jgi:hypothetical protein
MAQDNPPDEAKHPKRIENPDQDFIYVGNKDLKKVQKKAWDAGWWPAQKKSGILWRHPDETGQVMLHGTASDRHALENAISLFRKAGLDI